MNNIQVDDPPKIAGRYTCVFLYFNTIFSILQRNIVIYTDNFFLIISFCLV